MREMIFKAWNNITQEMSAPFTFNDFDVDYFIPKGWDYADMIKMQYTGLKDKNGVMIFEGDIIDCYMSLRDGGCLPHRGFIVYVDEYCSFATRNEAGETLMHNHIVSSIEVIGNIYTTPELIN